MSEIEDEQEKKTREDLGMKEREGEQEKKTKEE